MMRQDDNIEAFDTWYRKWMTEYPTITLRVALDGRRSNIENLKAVIARAERSMALESHAIAMLEAEIASRDQSNS